MTIIRYDDACHLYYEAVWYELEGEVGYLPHPKLTYGKLSEKEIITTTHFYSDKERHFRLHGRRDVDKAIQHFEIAAARLPVESTVKAYKYILNVISCLKTPNDMQYIRISKYGFCRELGGINWVYLERLIQVIGYRVGVYTIDYVYDVNTPMLQLNYVSNQLYQKLENYEAEAKKLVHLSTADQGLEEERNDMDERENHRNEEHNEFRVRNKNIINVDALSVNSNVNEVIVYIIHSNMRLMN